VLAANAAALNRFQPSGRPLPDWAAGAAYPEHAAMVIRSPRLTPPGVEPDPVATFTHELSHLVLAAGFGRRPIPRWLDEGLAMYAAYEWNPVQDFILGRAVLTGRLLPLAQLTRDFGHDPFAVREAYLQSYSLVNYLIAAHGRDRFARFLRALAGGARFDQALSEVYGLTPERFEADWRRHLALRYNWIPLLTSSAFLWFLTTTAFVAAYVYRRRRNRAILERWAIEEAFEPPAATPDDPDDPDDPLRHET
jgi:hypothetical protein